MPNIHQQLKIKTQPDKVYHAVSTIEGFSNWWTPDTTGSTEVGGMVSFHFGADYYKEFEVMRMEDRVVEMKCLHAVEEWINTKIIFMVEPIEIGSLLRFSHSDWKSDESTMFYQCSFDWAMFLRSLKKYCETGTGLPYPDQGDV